MPDRFLFLLGSSRRDGNCEQLARVAAEALPPSAQQRWLWLAELPLPPFADVRHSSGGVYPPPDGHAAVLAEATLQATDLVFAAPTYWYSLPAQVKLYLDHWTGWLRAPGLDFKARMAGKRLWAITVNADEPHEAESSGTSDHVIGSLQAAAEYLKMVFGGALVGHGNRPGEVLRDERAVAAARRLFSARAGKGHPPRANMDRR